MIEELQEAKQTEKKPERKLNVLGGLAWPEDGNPAFLVLLAERRQKIEDSLEPQIEYLEIVKEIEGQTLQELTDKIKNEVNIIYAPCTIKYRTYIKDFNVWKREKGKGIQLRGAVSSFESGVLKIKDFIKSDKLKFPEVSKVKEQLKIFSKLSFKNQSDFYAVGALSCVIGAVRNRVEITQETVGDMKSWY
jgi:hypothetical protein